MHKRFYNLRLKPNAVRPLIVLADTTMVSTGAPHKEVELCRIHTYHDALVEPDDRKLFAEGLLDLLKKFYNGPEPEHHRLVRKALAAGYCISVYDGEEYDDNARYCLNFSDIIESIESVEEALIYFYKVDSKTTKLKCNGNALITPYGVAPYETVADYSEQEWLETMLEEIDTEFANELREEESQ